MAAVVAARRWQAESDQQRPGAPAEGPCFPVAWVPFIRTMGKKAMANSEVHAAEAALLVRPESVESSTLRLSLARQAFKSVVANALLGVGNAYTSRYARLASRDSPANQILSSALLEHRSLQRLSELSETSQVQLIASTPSLEIFLSLRTAGLCGLCHEPRDLQCGQRTGASRRVDVISAARRVRLRGICHGQSMALRGGAAFHGKMTSSRQYDERLF
eukprot:scaffold6070_cov295-Pinguiococcus_pyrenoidosus.AAC.12